MQNLFCLGRERFLQFARAAGLVCPSALAGLLSNRVECTCCHQYKSPHFVYISGRKIAGNADNLQGEQNILSDS